MTTGSEVNQMVELVQDGFHLGGAIDKFDPLEYWEQRLRRNFGPGGVGCLGLAVGYNRWLSRVRAVAVRRALLPFRSDWETGRVLDVGSGTGFWIHQWQKLGVRSVVGSDFTRASVDRLRERWSETAIHHFDITARDLDSLGQFDAVSALDVFFHIVHDAAYARAWRNVARLLRPGGLFVLTENFLRHEPERQPHLVSRTLDDIVKHARAAGFEILDRRPVFVLMNRPIDSASAFLRGWWRSLERMVSTDRAGSVIGATLFPLEILLASILRQGPSTELMICRKT
jgi:2-polyprenyl-3-methyl-5-hydroxy-6-metoxy-1,4-benzoquinol methylase